MLRSAQWFSLKRGWSQTASLWTHPALEACPGEKRPLDFIAELWFSQSSDDLARYSLLLLGLIRCMQTACTYINILSAASVDRCYLILLWKTTVNAQWCLGCPLIIIQSSEATGYPQSKAEVFHDRKQLKTLSFIISDCQVSTIAFGVIAQVDSLCTAGSLSLSMLIQKRYHYIANFLV